MLALQRFEPVRFGAGAWANPPGPRPGTVYTSSDVIFLDNAHDLLYENVRFSGSSSSSESGTGLIWIMHASYNITFRNCIIGTNGYSDGNGVKIFDGGNGTHDITFYHCHFDYQPRMGFECISRRSGRGAGNWPGYMRVNLINCTFDAQGSEAISYDDDDPTHTYNSVNQGAGYCTISGNVVEGAGATYATWRRVFELNQPQHMTVANNFFGAGKDGIANLANRTDQPCDWTFYGNTWDGTHIDPSVTPVGSPQLWYQCLNPGGGCTFADTIITGAGYSSSWGYFDTVSGADFSGSTVRGVASATPTTVGTCTGNTWPTLV